jgi:hypothetical protein
MKNTAFLLLLVMPTVGFSQTFTQPNYAIKSHPTLEIKSISATEKSTVILMSIENRIAGGAFCADRNIYISYPDGTRAGLLSSNGIPVCPDTYKFRSPGERLDFVLTFPPLKRGTRWIDLIEGCSDNCFSFYGVILDDDLNRKIDAAYALAENKQPSAALVSFIKLLDEAGKRNEAAAALFYINVIKLSAETGNTTREKEWYNRLKLSGLPGTERYINFLNVQGISF